MIATEQYFYYKEISYLKANCLKQAVAKIKNINTGLGLEKTSDSEEAKAKN